MTNIVVLIKQVPDTWSERKLTDGDFTLDREAADAVLDEINERAVEEALLIKEKEGGDSTVTLLTAGPERATEAIRKALSMGADKAVHLKDDGMHMPHASIGRNCRIERAIIDKNAHVGDNVTISDKSGSPDEDGPGWYVRDGIVIVPKGAVIPPGTAI